MSFKSNQILQQLELLVLAVVIESEVGGLFEEWGGLPVTSEDFHRHRVWAVVPNGSVVARHREIVSGV